MLVTLAGITTFSRDEQFINASEPIEATPSAISTDVISVLPLKQPFSIADTVRSLYTDGIKYRIDLVPIKVMKAEDLY